MSFSESDHHYMQRALTLAERAAFSTDPNPHVGCVFVVDDEIVAEGWTQPAGGMHAEAMAISEANVSLEHATCYVTLEPCSHFGRTPPCADALVNSEITRVVIALEDPNPEVAGRGIAALQAAGVIVDVGLCASEAAQMNRGFIKRMTTGLPYVTMKMGMSMDAKTALASGESQWITCPESRQQVQVLRARSSAVITGRQTVVSDNPQMNVRQEQLPEPQQSYKLKQPIRVVLDSNRSLLGSERIFSLDNQYLWLIGEGNQSSNDDSAQSIPCSVNGKIALDKVLELLANRGCNEVLIEAGAELSGAFVAQDLVDEIQLFMAPVLLGHQGRDLIKLAGIDELKDKKQFQFSTAQQCGSDVLLTFRRGN